MKRAGLASGLLAGLLLSGCSPGADLPLLADYKTQRYTLGSGDQVRVITFGEAQLTGSFRIDDQGAVEIPLLGSVQAAGLTTSSLEQRIAESLRNRKLIPDASVSVEIAAFRPIFVLGEVVKPGQYPYQPGMTMLTCVAVAGGFTYRAVEDYAEVIRTEDPDKGPTEGKITAASPIAPGDVVKVFQRRF
jgi:polysaccharide export outer membrane protein